MYAGYISIASLEGLSCSRSNYRVEMHHVRHLKDLNPRISKLDKLMIARNRKQIPVCRECHIKIHSSFK